VSNEYEWPLHHRTAGHLSVTSSRPDKCKEAESIRAKIPKIVFQSPPGDLINESAAGIPLSHQQEEKREFFAYLTRSAAVAEI